jgi:homocysteine S-methyltransferase
MTLLERLEQAPLVGDGAMGTYLHELGFDLRNGPEQLNITNPDAIRRVHAAYLEAGAELLRTNTFSANRFAFPNYQEILRAGVAVAQEVAGKRAYIAGAIGPIAPADEAELTDALLRETYQEQVELLRSAGVDLLLLETFESFEHVAPAAQAALAVANGEIPVFVNMVFSDGFLASGEDAQTVAERLSLWGVSGVGVNCGRGMQAVRAAIDGLILGAGDRAFLCVYPNAGYPERIGGRTAYIDTSLYMAREAVNWIRKGARIVGGCCGTTPDAIRAIRQAVAGMRNVPASRVTCKKTAHVHTPVLSLQTREHLPINQPIRGGFLDAVHNKPLPIIAEIDPPPHLDMAPMFAGAKALLAAGADAVSLAENPLASARMENFFVAHRLRQETGQQVICHITGRDRNALATQSALMAAHASGLEAVLAVTGDPPQIGGHQKGVGVYENTSVGLVRLLNTLNNGRSMSGRDLKGKTNFSIGVAFNSAAANLDAEISKLRRKEAEGAQFIMTQPVFDTDQAKRVLEALAPFSKMRVFLGFLPPISERLALYLHNEVPGIRLPEAFLKNISLLAPADQERYATEATLALIQSLKQELKGIYLITPGAKWQVLEQLIREIFGVRDQQSVS